MRRFVCEVGFKPQKKGLERSITAVFGTNIFFADVLGIKGRNDDATEAERTQRKNTWQKTEM